jgi:hypothetical protein
LQEVKPTAVTSDAWQTLIKHWHNAYYKARTEWVTGLTALKYLREARPDAVPPELWEKVTASWETQYYAHVMDEVRLAKEVSRYAQGVDISLLRAGHKEAFEREVQRTIRIELVEHRTRLVEGLLGDLLKGKEIPSERPAEVPDHEWDSIMRLQEGLQRLRTADDVGKANAKKESELKALESELRAKREKVERQLQLIHDALTDPGAIARVEDYDDTFAKGNLDNLKKLAQAASQPRDGAARKRRRQGEGSG